MTAYKKRLLAGFALLMAAMALTQVIFAAETVMDTAIVKSPREIDNQLYRASKAIENAREALHHGENQSFDPAARSNDPLHERDDYREWYNRNAYRDNAYNQYGKWRNSPSLTDQARRLEDERHRQEMDYTQRRREIQYRMDSNPVGSSDYNRFRDELGNLERLHLDAEKRYNNQMRMLESRGLVNY